MNQKPFQWKKIISVSLLPFFFFPSFFHASVKINKDNGFPSNFPGLSIEQNTILNPAPETGGHFGESIDSSGHLVIVGAPSNDTVDSGPIYDAGAAYIYRCEESGTYTCVKIASLQAPDPQVGDKFGMSVGISGGTAIVSAPENGAAGDQNSNVGAVYVFERNQGGLDAWGLVSILRSSDRAPKDSFGNSIGIDGDWIVASAPWEDGGLGDPLPDAGAVYVFHRNQGTVDPWSEVAILHASDADIYDYFGWSLAISGETLVVGAFLENGGAGDPFPEAGAAYVFKRTGAGIDEWSEVKNIHASDAQEDDCFGQYVDIEGDVIVVVSSFEDGGADNYPPESGAAYIFHRDEDGEDNWGETAILHAPDAQSYDCFGCAIDFKNNLILLGAPGKDEFNGVISSNSGAVYMYRFDFGGRREIELIQKITHDDEQTDDLLGTSITTSGNYLFAGAPGRGSDPQNTFPHAGAVMVFMNFPHTIYLPAIFNH